MRRALLLCAVAALVAPAPALAHATLLSVSPGYEARLSQAPRAITLSFDQGVTLIPNSVRVYTEQGRILSGAAHLEGTRAIVTPLRARLRRGGYTIRWQALSADGHVVSGVTTFGVRMQAPAPTSAYGASGPTATERIVRWSYFACLAVLTGGLGFVLLCRQQLPPRAARRFYLLTGAAVIGTLEIGIAGFLLRAEDALQLPFGRLLYGDLAPIAGTRFGVAFISMTLGYALVAALLFLAWLTERRWLLWPAFLLAAAFASGLSLAGHDAVDAGSTWLSELADWTHLVAACLWLGGLVQLAAVIWPAAPEQRREAFLRFSRLAGVAMALVLLAGTYLSAVRLQRVSDLWTVPYGQVLLLKVALVLLALGFGAFHHMLVRPRLERGALAEQPVRRSLLGEGAVGMAILLAAAVLVNARPPAQAPPLARDQPSPATLQP
jgi:copper transport protein